MDRPTAFVISAEALIGISSAPETDLGEVKGLGPQTRRRLGGAIAKAVEVGLAGGPLKRLRTQTPFRPRPNAEQNARFAKLKDWRVAGVVAGDLSARLVSVLAHLSIDATGMADQTKGVY